MDWSKTTFAFVSELEDALEKMNVSQLAQKLNEFGLHSQAEDLIEGNMTEGEARSLLFTAFDYVRSIALAKERHRRKRARKKR